MSPVVSLVIAQPNLGKTPFILQKLNETAACLVLSADLHQAFKDKFSNFFAKSSAPELVDEKELEVVLKQKSFEHVVFLSTSLWDENEPMHLDFFHLLARFAVEKKINVWAAIDVTSAAELSLIQKSIIKVSERCPETVVETIALVRGEGILCSFVAKQKLVPVHVSRRQSS